MKHLIYILLVSSLLLWSCNNAPKVEKEIKVTVTEFPSVVEIVTQDSATTKAAIESLLNNNVTKTSIYQWKNHIIVFDTIKSITNINERLISDSLDVKVNYYESPFYIFSRNRCENKTTSTQWSHTIMTANLVADTIMQKEYMDYHTTQYEKWPEISNGFCNADFQQLLIFRNGRQLMLIISIPEGESLDELNPKTTENNPRVDEWNAIMAKYQEGIEGTNKNETWVLLEPIK